MHHDYEYCFSWITDGTLKCIWERIYSPKPEYAHVTCDIVDNPELELEAIKATKTRRSPHFVRKKKKQ